MDYATIADVYDVDALDYIKQVPLSDENFIVVIRQYTLPGGFTTVENSRHDR